MKQIPWADRDIRQRKRNDDACVLWAEGWNVFLH